MTLPPINGPHPCLPPPDLGDLTAADVDRLLVAALELLDEIGARGRAELAERDREAA